MHLLIIVADLPTVAAICYDSFHNANPLFASYGTSFYQTFTSLTSFKRTINDVDYSDFLKVFHSNFIIQYLLFSTFLSYCTMPLYVMGSCKCRRGLSDPWNACFYCSYCFSVFSDCLCFQNKLMMMMMKFQRGATASPTPCSLAAMTPLVNEDCLSVWVVSMLVV